MLGKGRGEKLTPIDPFKGWFIVLVLPPIGVPTAFAYKSLKRTLTLPEEKFNLFTIYRKWLKGEISVEKLLVNDFERPVFRRFPMLKNIKKDFVEFGSAGALMSGSSSTIFGLFRKQSDALQAVKRFRDKNLKAVIAKTVAP